jgi:hypothetical protein
MSAAVVVAVIIGVFFVIGLLVGGIMVIALPLLRDRRFGRSKPREPGSQPEYDVTPDAGGPDDAAPDDRPRWPGHGDNGHSGR